MDSSLLSLVFTLVVMSPLLAILVWRTWSDWFSPAARARKKAYEVGYRAGLAGATWHDSPFESPGLISGWRDGLEDARLSLRTKADMEKFERDISKIHGSSK